MIYPLFRYPENTGQKQLYNLKKRDGKPLCLILKLTLILVFNAFIVSL